MTLGYPWEYGGSSHPSRRSIYELCGMAALFSALFGTPLTAAIFVIEVVNVGEFNYRAMLPCLISSLTAALTAKLVGAPEELFPLAAGLADAGALNLLRAAGMGVLCGLVAFIFCSVMHHSGSYAKKLIKNDYVRVIVGGAAIIALTLIIGSRDYNGGGTDVILAALAGEARPEAFILKILFTAITLSFGFKGGEIVPSFFIGSTFGCAVAAILGLSPALGAGLGLVSSWSTAMRRKTTCLSAACTYDTRASTASRSCSSVGCSSHMGPWWARR